MRLTVLGNNGPYPAKGGRCSGYLLESDSGHTAVLLDCGPGILAELQKHLHPSTLAGIILSHLHYDHMSDMLPLHYALQFNPPLRPLNVYAPKQPESVRNMLAGDHVDVWPMENTVIGEMKLSFCPVTHPIETYAVSIECDRTRFVYTGDTNTDAGLELFCDGADVLMADCGLSAADYTLISPHLSSVLCGKLARDTGVRRLLLTHFNPKYDPQELCAEARMYFPDSEITVPGECYYL